MKYYSENNLVLYFDDTFERLKKFPADYVDMIFADPPYFLSNDGFSIQSGKRVSVNKGDLDKGTNFDEKHNFKVGVALEQEDFKILNNITWQKNNPPPNLSCRYFTHSTETILWAKKK